VNPVATNSVRPEPRPQGASRRAARLFASTLAASLCVSCGNTNPGDFEVLVFSKTAGFRHDSIDEGQAAIRSLGTQHGFNVTETEDATMFTSQTLATYDVVIFLSTSDDVLNDTQQTAFEQYIQGGGAYVGIHSANASEFTWPWYEGLVGALFSDHPAIQQASIIVNDATQGSTSHLSDPWVRTDEWYNLRGDPRDNGAHVLLTLDEQTYTGGTMGPNHPIAWQNEYDGGRSWYTGLGHTEETFSEPDFLEHLAGGILWAADR